MTVIKICGLTTLEDARWAAQCGADLLGFIFVPSSPRYVTPREAARITEALVGEGCRARFVGVFADEPAESVQQVAATCSLHLVQLHGHETPEYVRALGPPSNEVIGGPPSNEVIGGPPSNAPDPVGGGGLSVIVARRVRGAIPWEELSRFHPWAYLLDGYDPQRLGGTGQPWPWELLAEGGQKLERVILAGGLTPLNVAEALRWASPWGVDVSTGVETRPGRKDPAKVERFIRRVREAL